MDMSFDHAAWPHRRDSATWEAGALDWHGLRARFRAAQACRAEIGPERPSQGDCGSFHAAAAEALANLSAGTPGINPTGLVDLKDDAANELTAQGQQGPAIEGEYD